MAQNKIAFCLVSLVVILAFAFVTPSAMAQFDITLSLDPSQNVSSADGYQVRYGIPITIRITSAEVIQLGASAADLNLTDFVVITYNEYGGVVGVPANVIALSNVGTTPDGKNFTLTIQGIRDNIGIKRRTIYLPKETVELADPRAELNDDGTRKAEGKNAEASITINYVTADGGAPTVYSIRRASDPLLPVTAATENVIILLSEQPNAFTKDHVDVTNATWGDPVALEPIPEDEDGLDNQSGNPNGPPEEQAQFADNRISSGRDDMLYPYVLTITPKYENKNDIVVKVKAFEDMVMPTANKYIVPGREADYVEGTDKLIIKVGKGTPKDAAAGLSISVPENTIIPKDGYLVVAKNKTGSAVRNPGGADASPVNTGRAPFAQTYNLVEGALPNLESFLTNGGTIDVAGPKSLVITEIMWGSDASLKDADGKSVPSNSQWIELKNTSGAEIKAAADAYKLVFYAPNEAPPAKTAAVAATATALAVPAALPAGVTDRVGTITDAGAYWSIAGKGQSGRTGEGEGAAELTAVVQTQAIISMYRVADATDKLMDGNTAAAWTQSTPPSLNFDPNKIGVRIGSPGRDRLLTAADEAAAIAAAAAKAKADAAAAAKAADTSVSMPKVGQIYISEVMFAGGGTLPQWIEISNGSRSEQVNLSGWTLTVENATADADVSVGSKAVFTIPEGTKINESSQSDTPSTILVVTEQGRNNIDDGAKGAGQILNLWTAQQTELILLRCDETSLFIVERYGVPNNARTPGSDCSSLAPAPAPTTAAESQPREPRPPRRQQLMRQPRRTRRCDGCCR